MPDRRKGIDILWNFRIDSVEEDFRVHCFDRETPRDSMWSLEDDVLIVLLVSKADAALQGLLRLHHDSLKTFDQAGSLVKQHCAQAV